MDVYYILPSKRPWALEIHGGQKTGWALTRRSHCTYNLPMCIDNHAGVEGMPYEAEEVEV